MSDTWSGPWALWLGATVASFVAVESAALYERAQGRTGKTLSATLRRWLGIDPRHSHAVLSTVVASATLLWFGIHILGPGDSNESVC